MESPVRIIPYASVNGVWTLSDRYLDAVFARIAGEQGVPRVFFDGNIRTAQDFRAVMQGPNERMFTVNYNDRNGAVFWLNNLRRRACHLHFYVFRGFHQTRATEMGEFVLSFLGGLFDCVLGVIPEWNTLAIQFAQRVGMQQAGVVPNYLFDAYKGRSVSAVLLSYTGGE